MKVLSSSLLLSILCIVFNNSYAMDQDHQDLMNRKVRTIVFTQETRVIPFQTTAANPMQFIVTDVQNSIRFDLEDLPASDVETPDENCFKELVLALFCIKNQSEHEL